MNRMYSILHLKAVEDEQRIIRGTATTPRPDRAGDIVEPLGVNFRNPMPLLHQHDSDKPVGTVRFDRPTADGITFEARLPKIEEPGPLRDRVETAWGEVKAGLVRAVSIGFRALEYSWMDDGGIRFIETEVVELSLVTVPANADAVISEIKSIDRPLLAASGKQLRASDRPTRPGALGNSITKTTPKEGKTMKTIAEQISAFEATRATKAAELEAIMLGGEGETLDAEAADAADTLTEEIKSIDKHLGRLRTVEGIKRANAKPVGKADSAAAGTEARSPHVIVKPTEKLAPGINFARLAKAKALAFLSHGERRSAEVAKDLYGENSAVYGILVKANVVAGSSASGNWAADLVGDEGSVYADFAEYLRPMTIVGKFGTSGIPSLRRVPFRTPLIGQTGGGQAYWVGEGAPKPLTALDFARTTLDELKVATISVVTEELLRKSSPSADIILRDALAAAVTERLDIDFIDPAKAAAVGISPASITNGVSPVPSSGSDADAIREDVRALMATFVAANNPPTSGVWIMSSATALALSLMVNPLGQPEFSGVSMAGGTFLGLPVITSEYLAPVTAGGYVVLANASDIYFADEGGVMVDVSREASLQMLDNPTNNSASATATSMVSMWQTNSVAFRAERILNWAKRRSSAVALLNGVNWGQPGS